MAANPKSGSRKFANQYGEDLRKFFYQMQKKQLHGELLVKKEEDGSVVTVGREGSWRYADNRQGGQPFSGTITIWLDGVICFTMVYRGMIMPYAKGREQEINDCLREALEQMNWQTPWRGPNSHVASKGWLLYGNEVETQNIRDFSGVERIVDLWRDNELVYEFFYMGGIVNKN